MGLSFALARGFGKRHGKSKGVVVSAQDTAGGLADEPKPNLLQIDTVDIPMLQMLGFQARMYFCMSLRESAAVKIADVSSSFRQYFFSMRADRVAASSQLNFFSLQNKSPVANIIEEVGGEDAAVTTLQAIWHLLCQQGNGEFGRLLTNGMFNYFFVKDRGRKLRVVCLIYRGEGWHISAFNSTSSHEWHRGDRIFAPVKLKMLHSKPRIVTSF